MSRPLLPRANCRHTSCATCRAWARLSKVIPSAFNRAMKVSSVDSVRGTVGMGDVMADGAGAGGSGAGVDGSGGTLVVELGCGAVLGGGAGTELGIGDGAVEAGGVGAVFTRSGSRVPSTNAPKVIAATATPARKASSVFGSGRRPSAGASTYGAVSAADHASSTALVCASLGTTVVSAPSRATVVGSFVGSLGSPFSCGGLSNVAALACVRVSPGTGCRVRRRRQWVCLSVVPTSRT